MPREWREIDDDTGVGFSFPCEGQYGWRRFSDACPATDRGHGHVLIGDEGLTGRVPFCCASREGTAALLKALLVRGRIDPEMQQAVLGLASVRALPVAMTDEERRVLGDPMVLERMTDYLLRG